MKEPVLILSDLHLGHSASRIESARQLQPLIEGASTLILNGDTFQELARDYRVRSERLLDELRQLCAELKIELHLLPGNHDPGWEGRGWEELGDGKIVITHGDSVMWGGSPWSRESMKRRDQVQALWDEHQQADDDAGERLGLARKMALLLKPPRVPHGRTLFRRVLDALDPPQRALEIIRVWVSQPDRAADFAEHYFPDAEVLILGHFHWRGIWNRAGKLIINTGAFVNPHGASWVVYSDGWLQVGNVEEREKLCYRGDPDHVWSVGNSAKDSRELTG